MTTIKTSPLNSYRSKVLDFKNWLLYLSDNFYSCHQHSMHSYNPSLPLSQDFSIKAFLQTGFYSRPIRRPSSQCPTCGSQRASAYLSPGCLPCTPKRGTPSILFIKWWFTLGCRGRWALMLLLWAGHSCWQLWTSFIMRSSLLWSCHKHCQKDGKETWNVDYIKSSRNKTFLEHTWNISTVALATHIFL